MEKKSFIISGPTASSKSDFAHELALRVGGTIINADSVQIYKGIEILSAAPKPAGDVPYKLYSIVEPGEKMSAGIYAGLAAAEYDAAAVPVFVGGTGFYLGALTKGLSELPDAPRVPADYEALEKCDPETAARLHPNDTQRISRALGVFMATGKPLSSFQAAPRKPALPGAPFRIAIMPPRSALLRRAEQRREFMLNNGAVDEVEKFMDMDIKANGFFEIKQWLLGKISKDEMLRLWALEDAQYIKRQETWLRHQFEADMTIDHVPDEKDLENVLGK
ncbi:MAG: tRNA (adenosine(37)-N6)-dimethylallyltransferase MiaA [Rickettsiales bacterium]|jgi:tRNA dimethylallyltransferase|nr:tRNA (adenosine(37)-N6)-dimethylallyltransferase MiaA [Rickettsiales bacterium]